jgi:2-methylisocitrate lyase-like PEP mutase family enzyme
MVSAIGAWDCLTGLLVEQAGFEMIEVGGGGTSNFTYGIPDCGLLTQPEMIENAGRIALAVNIPVIADLDDLGPSALHVRRTIRMAEQAGIAAIIIEDTTSALPKHLWNEEEGDWDFGADTHRTLEDAVNRIKLAVASRSDDRMLIVARTDSAMRAVGKADAVDHPDDYGLPQGVERLQAYAAAGADILAMAGAPRQWLTKPVVSSLGAPLMHLGEIGHIDAQDWKTLEEAGVKIVQHGLLQRIAVVEAFRETLDDFKHHRPSRYTASQWELNRHIIEAVDLEGYTQFQRDWD